MAILFKIIVNLTFYTKSDLDNYFYLDISLRKSLRQQTLYKKSCLHFDLTEMLCLVFKPIVAIILYFTNDSEAGRILNFTSC